MLAAGSGGVLLDRADPPRVARKPIEARTLGTLHSAGSDEPLLLGLEDGAALFAVDLDGLDQLVRAGLERGATSVLAGFVSPGESLEEAVVREVREESGIEAYDTRFITSQPWPFPSSLMLGFEARSDGGEPMALDGELEDVRWPTLDDVRAASRGERRDLRLPPPISIARSLIDRWLARHRTEAFYAAGRGKDPR